MWRLAAARQTEPEDAAVSAAEADFFERQGINSSELPNWLASIGRDAAWHNEMAAMEAAYHQVRQSVLVPTSYKNEVSALRLPLTRFETEVIELESRDTAQEAMFCVTEDGMSMEEVAAEGRYPYRLVDFLLEDLPPDLQQLFISVSAGELLNPIAHADAFKLCRVVNKVEPDAEDPAVKARIEQRLLERHFAGLVSKYVERRLGAVVTAE